MKKFVQLLLISYFSLLNGDYGYIQDGIDLEKASEKRPRAILARTGANGVTSDTLQVLFTLIPSNSYFFTLYSF